MSIGELSGKSDEMLGGVMSALMYVAMDQI